MSGGGEGASQADWLKCEFISASGSLKQARSIRQSEPHFTFSPSVCVHQHLL